MTFNIANRSGGAPPGAELPDVGTPVGVGVDSVSQRSRRDFLTTVAGLAASSGGLAVLSSACGLPALVTTRRTPRIGHLRYGPPELLADRVEAFRQGLAELGYVEGQTIAIEWRVTPDNTDSQFAEMAADLVRSGVDVIVTVGSPPAVAAKHATSTIPIVFVNVTLPVELGLVDSLARPGGNVTGLAGTVSGLETKKLDFLRDLVVYSESFEPPLKSVMSF